MDESAAAVIELLDHFKRQVEEMGLSKIWEMRPLYDGKELTEEFKLKPSPFVGQLLHKEIEWQLENPEGKKEECLAYLATVVALLTKK